jgi:hypothetical protein
MPIALAPGGTMLPKNALSSLLFATMLLGSASPLLAKTTLPIKLPPSYASPNVGAPVELVETTPDATINWSQGTLTVKGQGIPSDRGTLVYRRALSERAALADAYRRMLQATQTVRVDTNSRIRDLAVADDVLLRHLSNYVKNSTIKETNYWPDGSTEIVLVAPLWGAKGLAALIAKNPIPDASASADATASGIVIATGPVDVSDHLSSVIVDARHLGAQPALFPTLRDDSGKAIAPALTQPLFKFQYWQDSAEAAPLAGFNPLKTVAIRTQGPLRADPVLSIRDSQIVKKALSDQKLGPQTPLLILE